MRSSQLLLLALALGAASSAALRAEEPSRFRLRRRPLWSEDPIADRTFRVHDLVSIIVRESAKATTKTETDLSKSSTVDLDVSDWFTVERDGLKIKGANPMSATGAPRIGVSYSRTHEGDGEIKHDGKFEAQLTAEVVEVLPNGNLVLEARKEVRVSEELSTLVFTGVVRPQDVRPDNTVLSDKVAREQVEYIPNGAVADMNRRGWLARFWDRLNIF